MAKSLPIPEQIEVAELLAGKAAGDMRVVQKLAPDPEINDDPVGFHAQQAVEKALKVALTLSGIDFPKTHDLDFLLALSRRNEIELPTEMAQVGWLTPWAAEFRYDDAPMESLDRGRAVAIASSPLTGAASLFLRTVPSLYA